MALGNRLKVPENVNSEYALISSILSDPEILYNLKIKPEYFYKPELREVCRCILYLFGENKPIDLLSIKEQLRINNKLDEVGGDTFLDTLDKNEYNPAHAEYYLQLIQDAFSLRNIIDLGNAALETGYTPNIQVDVAKNRISDLANKIFEDQQINKTYSLSDVVDEEWDNLHFRMENPDKIGIPTGFRELDLLTGGMKEAEMIIIAARTSVGKSALALKLAYNMAIQGHASLFWSYEMSRQSLVQRLVSINSGVNLTKIINAKLNQTEYNKVTDSLKYVKTLPIFFQEDVTSTIYDIMTKTRRMKQKYNIKALFVDYIQLMTTEDENQTQELGILSRNFKKLAMELKITSVILSQLNRNVESRNDKHPILSDIRQSGDIEQNGDKIIFIYRDEIYNPSEANKGIAELMLSKNRNGATANIAVGYIGETTNFVDLGRNDG